MKIHELKITDVLSFLVCEHVCVCVTLSEKKHIAFYLPARF